MQTSTEIPTPKNVKWYKKLDQKLWLVIDQIERLLIVFVDLCRLWILQLIGTLSVPPVVVLSKILSWSIAEPSGLIDHVVRPIKIIVGLATMLLFLSFSIVVLVIGGSVSSLLGMRNIGEYKLYEQVAAWSGFLILLMAAPLFMAKYTLYKMTLIFSYAIAVLGFEFLFGQCGILSLGHAGFAMLSGYFFVWLMNGTFGVQVPLLPAMIIAPLTMSVFSVLLGVASLRVKDFYLIIVTMCFSLSIPKILKSKFLDKISGLKEGGLYLPEVKPPEFLSFLPPHLFDYYLITILSLLLFYFAYYIILHSQYGRAFKLIRCDNEVSMILGIPVMRYKVLAFSLSAIYSGFAGVFIIYLTKYISHESFSLNSSIDVLVASVVGGPGSILGSYIGGAFITYEGSIIEWIGGKFPRGDSLARAFYGLLPVVIIFFMPKGIAGQLSKLLRSKMRTRRGTHLVAPPPDYDVLEARTRLGD